MDQDQINLLEKELRSLIGDQLAVELDNQLASRSPILNVDEEFNALKAQYQQLQDNSISMETINESFPSIKFLDWSKQFSLIDQIEAKLNST
jgi:hypothetical protein